MRHLLFFILSLSSVVALAQSDERVREIRAMYAKTQEVLKDQTEDEAINWSLKTTLRHNEPAVGVVRYEHEYYPLALLGAYDFVRSKRYVTVNPPSSYEILYDNGEPVFYFERSNWGDDVYEYRIYWDKEGTVCEYVPQRIEDGRKVKVGYDGIEMWFRADQAYRFAMQEYKRGVEGYNTNGEGVPLRPKLKPQSREGLYQCVNQIYDAYFTPEAMEEPDPESEADIIGLGKMTSLLLRTLTSTTATAVRSALQTTSFSTITTSGPTRRTSRLQVWLVLPFASTLICKPWLQFSFGTSRR